MQLTVGGCDVTLQTGLLDDLGISGNQTPVIRSCWTVTTTHYDPMLIVDLDMGLLIVNASDGGGSSADCAGLRWDAIQGIRQDEHTWMLLIATARGGELRFLLASLGELHAVSTRLASRRARFLDVDPGDGLMANVGASADAGGGESRDACARPPRRPASARARSRSATAPHEPSPALDRIEQRLATMELLLADLTAGSSGHPRN